MKINTDGSIEVDPSELFDIFFLFLDHLPFVAKVRCRRIMKAAYKEVLQFNPDCDKLDFYVKKLLKLGARDSDVKKLKSLTEKIRTSNIPKTAPKKQKPKAAGQFSGAFAVKPKKASGVSKAKCKKQNKAGGKQLGACPSAKKRPSKKSPGKKRKTVRTIRIKRK